MTVKMKVQELIPPKFEPLQPTSKHNQRVKENLFKSKRLSKTKWGNEKKQIGFGNSHKFGLSVSIPEENVNIENMRSLVYRKAQKHSGLRISHLPSKHVDETFPQGEKQLYHMSPPSKPKLRKREQHHAVIGALPTRKPPIHRNSPPRSFKQRGSPRKKKITDLDENIQTIGSIYALKGCNMKEKFQLISSRKKSIEYGDMVSQMNKMNQGKKGISNAQYYEKMSAPLCSFFESEQQKTKRKFRRKSLPSTLRNRRNSSDFSKASTPRRRFTEDQTMELLDLSKYGSPKAGNQNEYYTPLPAYVRMTAIPDIDKINFLLHELEKSEKHRMKAYQKFIEYIQEKELLFCDSFRNSGAFNIVVHRFLNTTMSSREMNVLLQLLGEACHYSEPNRTLFYEANGFSKILELIKTADSELIFSSRFADFCMKMIHKNEVYMVHFAIDEDALSAIVNRLKEASSLHEYQNLMSIIDFLRSSNRQIWLQFDKLKHLCKNKFLVSEVIKRRERGA